MTPSPTAAGAVPRYPPCVLASPLSLYDHFFSPVSLSVATTSSPIVLTFSSAQRNRREPWKLCIDDTLCTPTFCHATSDAALGGAPPPKPFALSFCAELWLYALVACAA